MRKCIIILGLALTACTPKTPQQEADQIALGARAFQKCYSCHALEAAKNDLSGPTLHGVVDRPIASERGFDYSPALRRLAEREHRWGRNLLSKFIADPEGLVPGTTMTFHGIADEAERDALIEYIERQTNANAASLP